MRKATVERKSKETSVKVSVNLDGAGKSDVKTGVRFLDHMLDSLSTHSMMDIRVRASGDLQHHTVEDVALSLGNALSKALGDRKGLTRFGFAVVPMDDALALAALDLVRRPYSSVELGLQRPMLEDAPREDLEHFFSSLATALEATLHVRVMEGRNDHHKFEAAVKAVALSLRGAASTDPRRRRSTPSSKGMM
ncbi:MAG TPA: imidazoleglycerol-phosphate dehydratase HisB [Nitrososphaerales archaeon]|nr:imidazoleglycerol-phosphate dehydratase HisB [Nitrososphaerales archaeon]